MMTTSKVMQYLAFESRPLQKIHYNFIKEMQYCME